MCGLPLFQVSELGVVQWPLNGQNLEAMTKSPGMFGVKSQFLSTLLVASLLLLIAQPVLALAPETEKGMVSLTSAVAELGDGVLEDDLVAELTLARRQRAEQLALHRRVVGTSVRKGLHLLGAADHRR